MLQSKQKKHILFIQCWSSAMWITSVYTSWLQILLAKITNQQLVTNFNSKKYNQLGSTSCSLTTN